MWYTRCDQSVTSEDASLTNNDEIKCLWLSEEVEGSLDESKWVRETEREYKDGKWEEEDM